MVVGVTEPSVVPDIGKDFFALEDDIFSSAGIEDPPKKPGTDHQNEEAEELSRRPQRERHPPVWTQDCFSDTYFCRILLFWGANIYRDAGLLFRYFV